MKWFNYTARIRKRRQIKATSVSLNAIGLPTNIADVFYKMKIDSFSDPIQFPYGYHIFKLTEKKALPSYTEMEKDLKETYKGFGMITTIKITCRE